MEARTMPREDSKAVIALALGGWLAAVAAGAAHGVFAKLSPESGAALAAFAVAFAPATVLLDARLRETAARASGASLAVMLLTSWVALLAGGGAWLRAGASLEAALAGAFPVFIYFVAPLAGALVAAAAVRLAVVVRRSAPATSPAARPAGPRAARTSARGAGAAGA